MDPNAWRDRSKEDRFTACGILGIDAGHMLWLIHEWAERNRTFHNFAPKYIENCEGVLAFQTRGFLH